MKKLNRKQKRTILTVLAFLLLGTAMLSVGVKYSDDINAKWDEITEKFEKDEEVDGEETLTPEADADGSDTEAGQEE